MLNLLSFLLFLNLSQALPPTAKELDQFINNAEATLIDLETDYNRARWLSWTWMTYDTEELAAKSNQRWLAASTRFIKESERFKKMKMSSENKRKIEQLRNAFDMLPPTNPQESGELSRIRSSMEATYGKGKYCRPTGQCLDLDDLSKILANSREPSALLEAWKGWHQISIPMRKDFSKYVDLSNKGSRELGFKDTGEMWRSKYELPSAEFAAQLEKIWKQVQPLYTSLHAYVRARLLKKYGPSVVTDNGPIPIHLLGNMWGQEWSNIYPLVAPEFSDPGFDLTQILVNRKISVIEMVHIAENFFTSLGLEKLPSTFWQRSVFEKPKDRDIVCHGFSTDIDFDEDARIKMCTNINAEDFATIHHELGHSYYDLAYRKQPYLFRRGANDGFHEAIGDTVSLSITPDYLVKIGLLEKAPDASKDIGVLLRQALDKVAFLPFGLTIDKWRWKVFSGEITASDYNRTWWDLKLQYQGVMPPILRTEAEFDPGAKFHIPSSFPYMRYFLAFIYQFQFHKALAHEAGCQEPLHRCSIFNNKKAGAKFIAMLQAGASAPWTETLYKVTGSRNLDAGPLLEYFAPLKKWLDEQNKNVPVGW